jgi:hypothetical protein
MPMGHPASAIGGFFLQDDTLALGAVN